MIQIDKSWTLFLDRDGVINRKLEDDYVKNFDEFEFLPHVRESLQIFRKIFTKIIIVTNQQGIGKGLMTEDDLDEIHAKMLGYLHENRTIIDEIYHCPSLASENDPNRKPEIGMALQAKDEFPDIDFKKSIMIGDSMGDMEFGRKAGMTNILFSDDDSLVAENAFLLDLTFSNWASVTDFILKHTSIK